MALTQVAGGMLAGSITSSQISSVAGSTITGLQSIPKSTLPTGSVLQVVQTSNNTKTYASTSVSLMSASITPTSSSSRILIMMSMAFGQANLNGAVQVRRNGTVVGTQAATIYTGSANGFNTADDSIGLPTAYAIGNFCYNTIDSPASTSSLSYDLYYANSSGTLAFNQQSTDNGGAAVSTITLMEIAS